MQVLVSHHPLSSVGKTELPSTFREVAEVEFVL